MTTDTLIKVENVSKKFCRGFRKSLWYGMQDLGNELIGRGHGGGGDLREDEFWAVKDVSFEVKRGECLGLIGPNGSGKTTLLRMLSGLVKPDSGKIIMHGRVGALIALGAGFNPILTGRENVYAVGAVLGLTAKKIKEKYSAIVEFAELEEFMDAPVQNYSSGMQVRLGFAVAVQMEPDVLLLDEILAVGDIGFTIKCLNAVKSLMTETAVIFVSHNLQHISQFCSNVMLKNHGSVICNTSNIAAGIDKYLQLFSVEKSLSGTGQAKIANIKLTALGKSIKETSVETVISSSESLCLSFKIEVDHDISKIKPLLVIKDQMMASTMTCPIFAHNEQELYLGSGVHLLEIHIGALNLLPGKYSFVIDIAESSTNVTLARLQGCAPFRIVGKKLYWSSVVNPVRCLAKQVV